jgi:uncharacterized protein
MPRTDGELVTAARRGDADAFGVLIGRHRGRLHALARTVTGTDTEAEDIAQEAVLAAYLGLDRLRDPDAFASWLFGIGLNLARMRVRARRRPLSLDEATHGWWSDDPTPEQAFEARELFELVRTALAVLPAAQRDVVLLHYYEGLTCQEIAALLGQSTVAVRVRLHRARGQLRRGLETLRPKEGRTMVEMVLEDVIAKSAGEGAKRVVLLREREGSRVLPIWIGAPEGDSLALHLGGESLPRPLTSDLTARLLEAAGANVERVTINRLAEKTFYAKVTVAGADVDARPSDALNLAARVGAPVFASDEVLEQAGLESEGLHDELDALERSLGVPAEPDASWASLTGAQVKEAWLARQPK